MNIQEEVLLKRCLIGYCSEEKKEKPTLADIKKWVSANWKNVFGVIYKLNEIFLFEFPNRYMAEQTIQGGGRTTDFSSIGGVQKQDASPALSSVRETCIRAG